MDILRFPFVRNKGYYSSVFRRIERKPGFLKNLSCIAFLRAFSVLKLSAYGDPFIAVQVVFLFYPVQHKVFTAAFDMA